VIRHSNLGGSKGAYLLFLAPALVKDWHTLIKQLITQIKHSNSSQINSLWQIYEANKDTIHIVKPVFYLSTTTPGNLK